MPRLKRKGRIGVVHHEYLLHESRSLLPSVCYLLLVILIIRLGSTYTVIMNMCTTCNMFLELWTILKRPRSERECTIQSRTHVISHRNFNVSSKFKVYVPGVTLWVPMLAKNCMVQAPLSPTRHESGVATTTTVCTAQGVMHSRSRT